MTGLGVVLAAVVHGHPDPEGQGGLALGDVAVADWVGAVGGDPELRVEPVEGLLAGPLGRPVVMVVVPVAVIQLMGQVGVAVRPGPDLGSATPTSSSGPLARPAGEPR
jgi:hypothetical protein